MTSGELSAGSALLHRSAMPVWRARMFCSLSPHLLIAAFCALPLPSWGQWTNRAAVDLRVTATDDTSTTPGAAARSDVYTALRPSLRMTGRGPNFDLSMNAAVDFVTYARGSQPDRALPLLDAELKSVLAERLLFFDASADVHQTNADAFGPSNDASSTSNRRTIASYRLSPYLMHEFSPRVSVLARHDESQTKQSGANGTTLQSQYSVARLVGKPIPVGFSLEASRLKNDTSGISTSEFQVTQAKAGVSVALFDEVVFGVVAGAERTRLLLSDYDDRLYGLNFRWVPTPRTELFGNLERRFFGHGGELRFSHRTPHTALSLRVNREPVTATSSLGVIGARGDVSSFLDAILSRGTPDPVQRAVIVQNLMANRGLQTSFASPVDVIATYPQLQTGLTASWVYLGARTTTSLSGYQQTLRQLTRGDEVVLAPVGADSRQVGAALEVNYRLAPQSSVDSAVRWSRIRGLSETDGQSTREVSVRFALVQNLSPRTEMTIGLQYKVVKLVDTNAGLVQTQDPTLVFAGITHRF